MRVEAGRLRQALARYYETAGYSDPVVIDVPRGTYVPKFSWRDIASAPKPSTNSALTTAGITSSAPGGNFANQAQKLNDTLRTFYTLATMHRLQIAAVNREIANARRTLQSSHALLKLATTGPASEIVGTDVPGHAGASNRRTRKHPTIGTPRRGTGTRPTGAGEG